MARSYEEVRQLAQELPEAQRLKLANALWDSVDEPAEGSETEIAAAWDAEIKRRLDQIDSGEVEMVPLDDVIARMDARIRSRQRG